MNMRTTFLVATAFAMGASVMLASPVMAKPNNTDSGFWTVSLSGFTDQWIVYPQADKVTMDGTWISPFAGSTTMNGWKVTLPKGVAPTSGATWSMSATNWVNAEGAGNNNAILNIDIKHSTWNLFFDGGAGLVLNQSGTISSAVWTSGTYSPPAHQAPSNLPSISLSGR
jgi:hypothetical protein